MSSDIDAAFHIVYETSSKEHVNNQANNFKNKLEKGLKNLLLHICLLFHLFNSE